MSHYCLKTLSSSGSGAKTSDKYYLKGLANLASPLGAYILEDGTSKGIQSIVIADPSSSAGRVSVSRSLFIEDDLTGLFVKQVPLFDGINHRNPCDDTLTYTLEGKCSVPNSIIHLVDASSGWNPSIDYAAMSQGYFGSVQSDSSGRFSFTNVKTKAVFSMANGTTHFVPKIPDGVLDTYPYYLYVENRWSPVENSWAATDECTLVCSDQIMHIVDKEFSVKDGKYTYSMDGLHIPGNYVSYTYTHTDPSMTLTKSREGSNAVLNIGGIGLTSSYLHATNFTISEYNKDGTISTTYPPLPAQGVMGLVQLVVDGEPKYSKLKNLTFSDIRLTVTDGLEEFDFIYTTIPAIRVDENGAGSNDWPSITIEGTCPSNIDKICVSLVDLNNINLKSFGSTLYTTTDISNGSFSFTFDGIYHKDVNTGSSIIHQKTTDYDGYVIWSPASTGTITVTSTSVTHNNCLSGDTLITMADDSQKRLDSLVVGDYVKSKSGKPTKVVKLTRGTFSQSHTLYHFSDGNVIDETYEHRFFNVTQGYWQKLNRWKLGDRAKCVDGTSPMLIKVEHINERVEQFGLWTESHDYFASNLLSGDVKANFKLLPNATLDQLVGMISSIPTKKLIAGLKEEE